MDSKFEEIKSALNLYFSSSKTRKRKNRNIKRIVHILVTGDYLEYEEKLEFLCKLCYGEGVFSLISEEKIKDMFSRLNEKIALQSLYEISLKSNDPDFFYFVSEVVKPTIIIRRCLLEDQYHTLNWLYKVKNEEYYEPNSITEDDVDGEKTKKFIRKHLKNWKKDIFPEVNIKPAIQK